MSSPLDFFHKNICAYLLKMFTGSWDYFKCGKRILFLLQLERLSVLICKYITLYKPDMVKLFVKEIVYVKLCDNFFS